MWYYRIAFFLFLSCTILISRAQQSTSYDRAWKQVDSLINSKGLTRSALKEVNRIYDRAKAEKNDAQLIKALVYRLSLNENIREGEDLSGIKELENEIAKTAQPAKSILQSILADDYIHHFEISRWKLYDRTKTINFKKDDINTWGIEDYQQKISSLYLQSISSDVLLKKTSLNRFEPVIIKGNARNLRPTLYDLLAHRALDYFKNDEREITLPSYAFSIEDIAVFSEPSQFATHRFKTADTVSFKFRSLQLFQELTQFHLADTRPDALLDISTDRLQFAYQHAVSMDRDSLYVSALKKITDRYGLTGASSQAWYLLARFYADRVNQFSAFDSTYRYEFLTAKKIAEQVLQLKDISEGKANAIRLLNEINTKELRLQAEFVNIPDQPFRLLVHYRNLSKIHIRIISLDKNNDAQLGDEYWNDTYWKNLLQKKDIRSSFQQLPDAGDLRQHRVEISQDGLPVGQYVLVASTSENFDLNNNPLAVQYFHVSNLAYISKMDDYYVRDRQRGKPVGNVSVQVWKKQYDSKQGRQILLRGTAMVSDNNGFFSLPKPATYVNEIIELNTKSDHLMLNEERSYSRPERVEIEEETKRQTFLFTDRSIYRPGQTIFFKGIVIRQQKSMSTRIETGFQSIIFLFDVNGQKIDSASVNTNNYGSYSGKFRLAAQLLNGQFRLHDQQTNGSTWFNVEEYKRPKFKVELKKPDSAYKLYDNINISGAALAFAGNPIGGAMVKFRVVRRSITPMWELGPSSRIWPPYGRDETEISNGQIVTARDGSFHIRFNALPDKSISKKISPVFHYMVYADITDLNGETRSASISVAVGYHSLQLRIEMEERVHTDSLRTLKIISSDLNDVFQKTTLGVSMYELKMPEGPLRSRYWEAPDTFVIRKEKYKELFPHDIYMNEEDKNTWGKTLLFTITDTTSEKSIFNLPARNWSPGWYLIEAVAKENNGDIVKAKAFVNLYDNIFLNPFAFAEINAGGRLLPGQSFDYNFCTNLDSVYLVQDINTNSKSQISLSKINAGCTSFRMPVFDHGEIKASFAFIKDNRFYLRQTEKEIQHPENVLKVTHNTYRDKTLPGGEEKWSVKISGSKKDKVAAEVLLSMYDASLDEFNMHQWRVPAIYQKSYIPVENWRGSGFESRASFERFFNTAPVVIFEKNYDRLITKTTQLGYRVTARSTGIAVENQAMDISQSRDGRQIKNKHEEAAPPVADSQSVSPEKPGSKTSQALVQIRKNFNETAFFFPDLKTDSSGNVEFSFTMPEALTSWKWMTMAHTKELAFGYAEKTIITQKQLMVQLSPPRFLREGDRMDFTASLVNMSGKEITGQVELQLIDPATNQSLDGLFRNIFPNQYFTAGAGLSVPVRFTIEVPFQFGKPVTYRVIARSDSTSDGEVNVVPVLSNRIMVTESIPLPVKGNMSKQLSFDKLRNSGTSETLNHHSLTIEFTSNPAWYAVQALPYIIQSSPENSEQLFNRFYANALASKIANASPRLKNVFESWKSKDTGALMSALEKNEELKSVLLQETPWVMEAKSDAEQKKKIALLFDMARMSIELENSLKRLKELQTPSGSFSWFRGGPEDRFITQYILIGFGRLQKINALPDNLKKSLRSLILPSIKYLDYKIKADYELLIKKKSSLTENHLGNLQIQYLYMRSLFKDIDVTGDIFVAYNYYRKSSQKFWLQQNRYMQGMIALSLHRTGDVYAAKNIVASLKQNAIFNEEMGMYWKDMSGGYFWHQAPIESQALLIESFLEITGDIQSVEKMKTWLLKNKQTNQWKSSKATAEACFALLLQGTDMLQDTPEVEIRLGDYTVKSSEQKTEAGTGYFKKILPAATIKPAMGDIGVFIKSNTDTFSKAERTAWGAIHWQYVEDMDKIQSAATPLNINKKLFVEKNSDSGPVLQPVNKGEIVHIGDKIKVRIELRVDRPMEYVHMKDARASSLEPLNVLSGYKWQGGLTYYESTSDASTHFYFHYLPKGTFVFEYTLFITHSGTYSNGITTIESMYAPEYRSHTEGIRLNIEE